jgi:hypothetical protein
LKREDREDREEIYTIFRFCPEEEAVEVGSNLAKTTQRQFKDVLWTLLPKSLARPPDKTSST